CAMLESKPQKTAALLARGGFGWWPVGPTGGRCMTSSMNIPLASPGRLPNRVITQSPAVGFRTMLGGGCPVAITIARNAKSMCDLQAMASARVRSPPPLTHLQGSPRASPVNQRGRVEMVNLSATTGPGISTPQQIPAGRGAVPSEARMVLKAPFQAGPSMQLGVPNRVPPPSVRRTFNTTHTAVVPTVHRSSSADRRCFVQQLPCAGVIGSRQVSGTSEGTEVPLATARTARRMSPIRTACKASAAAPVRLQPASLLSKVPLVSSLALNGRREETDEVILQQVTKLQNSLMQQIESTKQQIQRQTAHGAKQVNGHLNPQAVAALSLHGAPVARPVAGTVPALPRSAAAPPARPVAPGAGSLTLPPKPERVERVERVEVLSRSVKLTLPVKEEMEGSQGAQNGALAAVHAALRRAAVDAAPHPLAAPTRAISAAARASCWTVALGLVELLRAVHLRADAYVFGAALSATERAAQWSWAVSLLAGLGEINEVLLNSAVSACEKGGRWAACLRLLRGARELRSVGGTVVGQSAAMAAVAPREAEWPRAFLILEQLFGESLRPDVIAFNSAFRACAFADAAHVQRLLRLMRQNAAEPDVVTSNTLISSYSRQLAWEESLAGVVQGRGNYPVFSSIACNAALSSLGFESNWPTSLALLEDVQMKGKADVVSFGAAMTALARASQSRLSLKLLDSLDDDLTNEQIYSAAISSCEGESCWKSVDLLKQARHRQVRLDVTVYGAACNVCEKGNFWESAMALLPGARAADLSCSTVLANAAVSSCAKSHVWPQAMQLLQGVDAWSVELDSTSYNSGLSSLVRTWPLALELLAAARRVPSHIGPSTETTDSSGLNAAATALGEGHRWRFAALLLAPALGIETDGISVNVALEALAKAASWERSLVLSSAISGVDLELDELGRASLITACTWRSQWAAALRGITVSTEVTSVEAPVVTALLAALVAQRAGHAVGLELMRRLRGRGVRAGAAAARIQRAWKKRKSSRPEVRPEEALPPPVKRLAPQHWAASRIQRAWKISRWRRVFIVDCKRDLGWLGSLDWLQRHNMLYGTELAETEDLEWWYHQQSGAPLDYEVDPWGCRKLREHLNRMWFGGEEPPPEPPARPAPGPAGPAPRAAATNPAVPVARPRASLGGYSGAGRVVPTLRLGQARSLAAPVAVPRPVGTAISPRVEGRQLLSASAATLHRCASPTLIRTHRPGLSAAAPVHDSDDEISLSPGERGAAKHHGLPGASAGASAGPHGVLRAAVATRQPAKLSAARGSEPGRCGSGAGLRGRPGARL
ncbi:unnamed protein product, partial [Durusdinium trenchii]